LERVCIGFPIDSNGSLNAIQHHVKSNIRIRFHHLSLRSAQAHDRLHGNSALSVFGEMLATDIAQCAAADIGVVRVIAIGEI
jgi:hypothetical protein